MDEISEIKKYIETDELLICALTHRSWVNENKGVRNSNERLEFLGDAVLELVVTKEIFERFPENEEGFLTALRANLVNTSNLANIAKSLSVGKAIFLSKGEEEGGGRDNPSLLADTMEAIIGAIFLDNGMERAYSFINKYLLSMIDEKIREPLKDPKSLLQELVQSRGLPTPKYKVVSETGPDHSKLFVVQVVVDGKVLGEAEGKSKSEGQQASAQKALDALKEKGGLE